MLLCTSVSLYPCLNVHPPMSTGYTFPSHSHHASWARFRTHNTTAWLANASRNPGSAAAFSGSINVYYVTLYFISCPPPVRPWYGHSPVAYSIVDVGYCSFTEKQNWVKREYLKLLQQKFFLPHITPAFILVLVGISQNSFTLV